MPFVPYMPNPDFERELEAEPLFMAGMLAKAEEAVVYAKALAPVDEGDYRDSIKALVFNGDAYLSAFDFKAWWIEYGTAAPFPTPAFAPLRRAVVAAGMSLHEEHR